MTQRLPGRTAGLLALLVGCVFGIGVVAGLGAARWQAPREGRLAAPERIFLDTFAQDFKLSARQRQELRIVLEEKERQKRELMEEHLRSLPVARRARFRQADREADRRIYAILDPEQRRRYRQRLDPARGQ